MLHECNTNVQTFSTLHDWSTSTDASNPYRMFILSDLHPTTKHFRAYECPQSSENGAFIPRAENGTIGRHDIVFRRFGEPDATGFERFDTIPGTHRS